MATCTCIASQIFCFPLLLMGKLNSVKSFPPPQFSDSFGPHRQKRTRTINHPPFPSPLSFSTLSAASAFSAKIQWLFSSPLYQSKTKVFLFSFFFLNCKGKTKIIKSKETPYTPLSFNASQANSAKICSTPMSYFLTMVKWQQSTVHHATPLMLTMSRSTCLLQAKLARLSKIYVGHCMRAYLILSEITSNCSKNFGISSYQYCQVCPFSEWMQFNYVLTELEYLIGHPQLTFCNLSKLNLQIIMNFV